MRRNIEEKPELNEIRHHGVKGQRWGVRKDDEPNPSNKKPSLRQRISNFYEKKYNEHDARVVQNLAKRSAKIEEQLKNNSGWFKGWKERKLADIRARMRLSTQQRKALENQEASAIMGMGGSSLPFNIIYIAKDVNKIKSSYFKEELNKIRKR